jgi:hypothetical protein
MCHTTKYCVFGGSVLFYSRAMGLFSLTAIPRCARASEGRCNAPGYAGASPCPDALARLQVGNLKSKKTVSLLHRIASCADRYVLISIVALIFVLEMPPCHRAISLSRLFLATLGPMFLVVLQVAHLQAHKVSTPSSCREFFC